MPGATPAPISPVSADERLGAIHDRFQVLAGQLNVIHAEITQLTAEAVDAGLLGGAGVSSVGQWLEWRLGLAPAAAQQLAKIADRRDTLPATTAVFDGGQISVDQAGAVARRAPDDLDTQYAQIAQAMTVRQLRTATKLDRPPPAAEPRSGDEPRRDISHGFDDLGGWYLHVRTDAATGASFDAGLRAHFDALLNDHRLTRAGLSLAEQELLAPPTWFAAFERLVEASLATEAAARPWNSRTKVVVHLDAERATLHLGPVLTPAERALLTCDATVQTVLEQFGTPVNVGREHRITPAATRMIVESRDGGCQHPLCRRTGTLVVHHITHWEHGGVTDTDNLITLCPAHHRAVHRGDYSITGNPDAADTVFLDRHGWPLVPPEPTTGASPPTPAPQYEHPSGERMSWRWYTPPDVPPATDN